MGYDKNTKIKVKNRSSSMVVYRIPQDGIRREFAPGQTQEVLFGELEKLTWQPGGKSLMANFLQIQLPQVVDDLGIHTEPEYAMSEQQIIALMKEGSLDAFKDCLDFAPVGVIDLIKKFSVELPLMDIKKRDALRAATGFDVAKALENIAAEEEEEPTPAAPTRRVKAQEVPAGRRTLPNYNVISTSEPKEGANN